MKASILCSIFMLVLNVNIELNGQYDYGLDVCAKDAKIEGKLNLDSGDANTFAGKNSGIGVAGLLNTSFGAEAFSSNQLGNGNTAVGYNSLHSSETSFASTAVGSQSLSDHVSGNHNTAIGMFALRFDSTGNSNTGLGAFSLQLNKTGMNNTACGANALLTLVNGSNNTTLGYNAGHLQSAGHNNIVLGANTNTPFLTSSHQVRIGNDQIWYAGIQVAWTITSDRKWKEKIEEVSLGLDFINELKPVNYYRKKSHKKNIELGFIAQDLKATLSKFGFEENELGLLTKDDNGLYSVRYNDLIAPVVKAIQEQSDEINRLKEENKNLKERLIAIEKALSDFSK